MRRITSLFVALLMIFSLITVSYAEVTGKTYGQLLFDLKLIKGSSDGLNEAGNLTRAEMVAIINRLSVRKGQKEDVIPPTKPTFSDVPLTHWAFMDVEKAYANGITLGVGSGKFGVDDKLTYQQTITFLIRVLGYKVDYDTALETGKKLAIALNQDKTNKYNVLRSDVFELLTKTLVTPVYGNDKNLLDLIPTYAEGREQFYLDSSKLLGSTIAGVPIYEYKAPANLYKGTDELLKKASNEAHLNGREIERILKPFVNEGTEIPFVDFYRAATDEDVIKFVLKFAVYGEGDFGSYGLTGNSFIEISEEGVLEAFLTVTEGQGEFTASNPQVFKFNDTFVDGRRVIPYYIIFEEQRNDSTSDYLYRLFLIVDNNGIYKAAGIGGYGDGIYIR